MDRKMPRLFRKSALRKAPHAPQNLSFEPANGKPPQQPNTPAACPGVIVASRHVLACRTSSPARCVPRSTSEGQAASLNKVTNMVTVLLHGCYKKDLTDIQVALC